eukprot:747179-Hanusia_phi.AAC.2
MPPPLMLLTAELVQSGSTWDLDLLSSGPWLVEQLSLLCSAPPFALSFLCSISLSHSTSPDPSLAGGHAAAGGEGMTVALQRQAQWLPWAKNVASQDYDVRGGRVRNRGEIWGGNVFVTVQGELKELQPDRKTTPKLFQADIQSGSLHRNSSESCFSSLLTVLIAPLLFLRSPYADTDSLPLAALWLHGDSLWTTSSSSDSRTRTREAPGQLLSSVSCSHAPSTSTPTSASSRAPRDQFPAAAREAGRELIPDDQDELERRQNETRGRSRVEERKETGGASLREGGGSRRGVTSGRVSRQEGRDLKDKVCQSFACGCR